MGNTKKIIASVVAGLMCINICTVNAYALNQEKKVVETKNISKGIRQISINYESEYNNSKFKVNYLKAARVNDGVEFELSYESPENSDFSFFNPPNGDKLMKRFYGGIKEGKNIAKFKLTQRELQKALQDDTITMCFGFNDNLGWIFFDKGELERIDDDIYEDYTNESSSEKINLNFGESYENKSFKVKSLKASKISNGVEFELSYESPEDSDFSFFNPPNGDKLMKTVYGGIKKGKNTTKFKLTQKQFEKALQDESITMKFGFNNNLGWIFIDKDQLEKIDHNIDEDNNNNNNNNSGDNGNRDDNDNNPGNNKDEDQNNEKISEKTELSFSKRYVDKNFKIDSLKAIRTNEGVEFELSYVSPKECNFQMYYPSFGWKFNKWFYTKLHKGKNVIKFNLTNEEFEKVLTFNNMSMLFGDDYINNAMAYITIDRDEFLKIDGNVNEENNDKPVLEEKELEFTSDYENKDFKVKSLKARRFENYVEFEFSYVSPEDADFNFFNPPIGAKVSKCVCGGIQKGENIAKFKLSKEEFEKVLEENDITMRFQGQEGLGWIFIDKSQFRSLMNNTNEIVKKTGWISVENKEHKKNWYYIFQDGTKAYGWQLINGIWYYFDVNNDGVMIENQFVNLGVDKYYLDENGSMIMNRWLDTDNGWIYFQHNGSSARDWAYINGVWYYFDSNGIMLKGWNYVNGTWYYFYESGAMAVNVVIDGWRVNGSGVATPF